MQNSCTNNAKNLKETATLPAKHTEIKK